MDREVIELKLESLRRCLKRIQDKRPATADALKRDPDLQDIITLNLTRAVQLCVDIGAHLIAETDLQLPDTMGQTFDVLAQGKFIGGELALRMKKSVGFRNIAVHNYEDIDWDIVHAILENHLGYFLAFAKIISSRLAD